MLILLSVKSTLGRRQSKYSAYGTGVFSCLVGAIPISPGQEAGCIPQEAAWRHDVRCVLQEDRATTEHALSPGAVSAVHHPWPATADHGSAEGGLAGCVRWREVNLFLRRRGISPIRAITSLQMWNGKRLRINCIGWLAVAPSALD